MVVAPSDQNMGAFISSGLPAIRSTIAPGMLYALVGDSLMNQTLKKAIREVEALPDPDQEELGRALMNMALRKKIDAHLAAAEASGGATAHEEVAASIRARYGK
jgi:hypothetical protein